MESSPDVKELIVASKELAYGLVGCMWDTGLVPRIQRVKIALGRLANVSELGSKWQVYSEKIPWMPADLPPDGLAGLWTREVVVITSLLRLDSISYFHGENGSPGCWQRPSSFQPGEKVLRWTEYPCLEDEE
jgi:hypothetical protein